MASGIFGRQTTACPYCYKEMNVNKVAFRCAGRGAPGLPACVTISDSKRMREFSDSSPVMPTIAKMGVDGSFELNQLGDPVDLLAKASATCLRCGGESGVRMCPECHSILPRSFDRGSPMFGLVGVRNSGKTVMLSVLHKELVRNVALRFNSSIDTPGGSTGLARDLALFEENMSRDGGTLPPQTAATGSAKKTPAVYEWKYKNKKTTASTIFSFYDSAGEDLSRQDQAMMQQYLGQSSGVILLLDPFAFPENQARAEERGAGIIGADTPESALDGITYVLQTTHKVKRNKKITVPLAVVISKIDAFFDQVPPNHPLRQASGKDGAYDLTESETIHDHVAAMITQWGGHGLLRKLEQEYSNFRLFGVSALGAEPEYKTGVVNTRGLLPHRVADPLLWLMANRDFIPSKES